MGQMNGRWRSSGLFGDLGCLYCICPCIVMVHCVNGDSLTLKRGCQEKFISLCLAGLFLWVSSQSSLRIVLQLFFNIFCPFFDEFCRVVFFYFSLVSLSILYMAYSSLVFDILFSI